MKDNDFFYLKEIAWSAFRGANKEARTVFYSRTGEMEDAKMLNGVFVGDTFYEFAVIRRRDPIRRGAPGCKFIGSREAVKNDLMMKYYEYVTENYPILKIFHNDCQVFCAHCGVDYEIIITRKIGVKREIVNG